MSHKQKIILFGHPMCPMVGPVMGMLARAKADYEYINIHRDEAARARVRAINHGNESVPTLVFPDGSTLTEPSSGQLQARLEALGYHVPLSARLIAHAPLIITAAVILLAVLRGMGVL